MQIGMSMGLIQILPIGLAWLISMNLQFCTILLPIYVYNCFHNQDVELSHPHRDHRDASCHSLTAWFLSLVLVPRKC